jgi:hypothetical protein
MGLLDDAIREHLDLKRRRGADPAEVERAEREALGPVRRGPEELTPPPSPDELGAAYDQETEWRESLPEPGDAQIFADVVRPGPMAVPAHDEPGPTELHEHEFAPGTDDGQEPDFDTASRSQPPDRAPLPLDDPDPLVFEEPEPLALEEQPRRRGFLGRRRHKSDRSEPEDIRGPQAHEELPADPMPTETDVPHGQASGGWHRPVDAPGSETVEYEVEAAFEAEQRQEREDVLEETPEFLQDTPDHDRLWFEQRPPRDFDFDG